MIEWYQIEVFRILNGHEHIDHNIFFKIRTGEITRGHDFTLVNGQSRLDFWKYAFSKRTVIEWNKLTADCVHSSSVNMFKNRKYHLVRIHLYSYMWTLDKPTSPLSAPIRALAWMAILLNLKCCRALICITQ